MQFTVFNHNCSIDLITMFNNNSAFRNHLLKFSIESFGIEIKHRKKKRKKEKKKKNLNTPIACGMLHYY